MGKINILKWIVLACGGALGTLLRYGVSGFAQRFIQDIFPLGTLVINWMGCLLIGFLWELFQGEIISPNMRIFIFIGILGGFTTFSSYSLETFNLIRNGEFSLAMTNIFLSNVIGIGLVFLGSGLARLVLASLK